MNETDRIAYNNNKLQEMYAPMRAKIQAIIKEMELYKYRPRLQQAWRSPVDQLDAYKRGTSKVMFGFHNTTGANGVKESLAVDIWDDDRLEQVKVDFMLHLTAAAEAQGLTTGIRWDLSAADSAAIDLAIKNKNWGAPLRVGFDPLHVEPTGITIDEAKAGKRPDFQNQPPGNPDPPTPPTPPPAPIPVKRNYRVQNIDTNESTDYTNWSTAFKPVTLLPVPYVSQLGTGADMHKNDCGAASAVMLLRAYVNSTMTPDDFYTNFNITGDPYLSVATLVNAMSGLGVLTTFKAGLMMADLFNTFATGKPVIVLIRYKTLEDAGLTEKHYEGPHFAVGVGMDSKYIYVHDPLYTKPSDGEAHAYPLDMFWKAWKDVALDPQFPNPERGAIIPAVGLGYPMQLAMKVNIPSLNVRSGPGLTNTVVGSLKLGQVVNVTREVNGWGQIATNQWIFLQYTLPVS